MLTTASDDLIIGRFSTTAGDPNCHAVKRRGVPFGARFPTAWRIKSLSYERVLFMGFARQRDASMALAALNRAGITCGADIVRAGVDEVERIMVESLQW